MLCKNPDCGIYRLTYDLKYDKEKDLEKTPCTFCGQILSKTGADLIASGLNGLIKEKRQSQIDYIETIDQQLERGSSVTFIEGGTGVGKSFAYLIPTILELLKDRHARAMVVTSNKALQKQLLRDLPTILESLGADDTDVLSYSLLKGRNNYACPKLEDEVPNEYKAEFQKFIHENKPADKDKWPSHINSSWWGDISTDNCPEPGFCSLDCRDRGARAARLIITNYSYFGIFTRLPFLIQKLGDSRRLKILVMDEAHQAVSYIRNALKVSITPHFIRGIIRNLTNSSLYDLLDDLQIELPFSIIGDLNKLANELEDRFKTANDQVKSTFRPPTKKKGKRGPEYDFDEIVIEDIQKFLDTLDFPEDLIQNAARILTFLEELKLTPKSFEDYRGGCIVKSRLITKLRRLDLFFQQAYSDNFNSIGIATLNPDGLALTPIDIGACIRPTIDTYFKHVIVTSATLAHTGNDFSHIREALGYANPDDKLVEKVVGSPFDLGRAARLYVPRLATIPAREQTFDWYNEVAEEIIALATASQGNGFVLFSSTKDLHEIDARTRNTLANAGIPVLAQVDEIPAATLTKEYLETPNSMLYGLRSFWEGVDIKGQKLSLVIIPKLPFAVPTDPIQKARCDRAGKSSFMDITVPDMLDMLRQGTGRLIRSSTDMGLIAILDSRFWSGTSKKEKHAIQMRFLTNHPNPAPTGYGRQISKSLGLKLIDSREYACTILKTTIALYNKQKSA